MRNFIDDPTLNKVRFYFDDENHPTIKQMEDWLTDRYLKTSGITIKTFVWGKSVNDPIQQLIEYGFINEDEATHFKLVWGGSDDGFRK